MEPQAVLQQAHLKVTRTGAAVIRLLAERAPLSVPELCERLQENNIPANKTTVYRLLKKLAVAGVARELSLQPGILHFELNDQHRHHHHHLVCQSCRKVEHLAHEIVEKSVRKLETELARVTDFTDITHSLEFYGYCRQCRS